MPCHCALVLCSFLFWLLAISSFFRSSVWVLFWFTHHVHTFPMKLELLKINIHRSSSLVMFGQALHTGDVFTISTFRCARTCVKIVIQIAIISWDWRRWEANVCKHILWSIRLFDRIIININTNARPAFSSNAQFHALPWWDKYIQSKPGLSLSLAEATLHAVAWWRAVSLCNRTNDETRKVPRNLPDYYDYILVHVWYTAPPPPLLLPGWNE